MGEVKFSANLGFLYTEYSLPDAIQAAADDGFLAVDCHQPYDVPPSLVCEALQHANIPMLGLNVPHGPDGTLGYAAVAGCQELARAGIDQAVEYASEIGAQFVHVLAGNAKGAEAEMNYVTALKYACERADKRGLSVLIEPMNAIDAPHYFLGSTAQAVDIIQQVGAANLGMMFDCYHVAKTEGDVLGCLRTALPYVRHVQIAGVPARNEPDIGEVDYQTVIAILRQQGYTTPISAEYRPASHTRDGLDWMKRIT